MIEERIEKIQSDLGKVQAELDELKAQMNPKPEDRFVPQFEQRYWYVDSVGEESTSIWTDSPGDLYRLATGNCHRTEADARRHKAGLFVKTPTGPCPKVCEGRGQLHVDVGYKVCHGCDGKGWVKA